MADTSDISDPDGVENAAFTYQWIAAGADIEGETGSSYTIAAEDEGLIIQVWVSFTDDAGNHETRTSQGTEAVEPATPTNTPATGQPVITGTARVRETLTANTSGISNAEGMHNAVFTHRWIAGGTDIQNATGASYTLTEDEEGLTIQVWVSFTDDGGNPEAMASAGAGAGTGAVAPALPLLTVSLENNPASHDGQNVFTFEIRFSEEFNMSFRTLKFHAFNVTGGSVKKAQRMDQPSNISWRIRVRPDSNADVTVVLPVTTGCNAQGAICTQDGRKLSNSLNFTVSGPGQ